MMQKISYAALAALVLFTRIGLAQPPAHPRSVAITIDDGPAVNEMKDLGNFQRIARGLLSSLEAEKVPATIFINERQLNVPGQRDGRAAVLAMWLDAGY
ncbi:MAG TPA: polysaccharide deacetylase family protein, partial [Candidatus Solibacter sp.]|nr:polysaccharide deacetylase family protein [Candidatus Solibacter sp.]